MKPSVARQVVSLMGRDDKPGNGVPGRLRIAGQTSSFKTEQAVQQLKDTPDKEMSS